MLSNLADLTDLADLALVLGMVLGPVKGAFLIRCSAVDGRVAGRANVKLRELVELDLNGIAGVALALLLRFGGLRCMLTGRNALAKRLPGMYTYVFYNSA